LIIPYVFKGGYLSGTGSPEENKLLKFTNIILNNKKKILRIRIKIKTVLIELFMNNSINIFN